MKNILARGGIEFLAVLLGITLSLYIDQKLDESAIAKTESSLLSDLQVSLNQDIDYAEIILDKISTSLDAQEKLIAFSCNEVDDLNSKDLATLFKNVMGGSSSLFPRYGVYRSLVSNSEMKYIDNQELKEKLISLYDFQFKRYENVDPIITNRYQYSLGDFLVNHFGFTTLQSSTAHMVINKDAFCQGTLRKEIMKISGMTKIVYKMVKGIQASMNTVSGLIDEELNQ